MKKIFAIFLALLVIITNLGITFATHYCSGKAVKTAISLGHDDISCGMAAMDSPCDDHSPLPAVKRSGCCENEFVQLKIADDYNTPVLVKANIDFPFVAAFITSYINLYEIEGLRQTRFFNYSPPLLSLDIPVHIQSFLI